MTERSEPDAPVKEIGNVLYRLLHFIDSVVEGYVVMLHQIDLSDGLLRIIVEEESKGNFA